jgi:glycosyltransferase involved in cell wall biosynthesis
MDLGHKVTIVDNINCSYTWGEIRAEHRKIRNPADIPDADAVISTGFKTVIESLSFPARCGKRFHWIRGWETWTYPGQYIRSTILGYPVTRMVNGVQLQQKLAGYGVASHLVRPGYDFDKFFFSEANMRSSGCVVVGGLYNTGKKRGSKRTEWILETAARLKREYNNVNLTIFGVHENPKIDVIDTYHQLPPQNLTNTIYNLIHIWLAPTMLEGLHKPPAEAMLTECPVVGTDAELSGMSDYLVHNKTGLVAENNLDSFVEHVSLLVADKELRRRLGKQARQAVLALGNRQDNMQKMVEVLENG